MKKSRFSESQIVNILQEAESGMSVEDLSRQHGFSKATFYKELRQLADRQPRWRCGKMTDYLTNEGHAWSHKRIRRIYRDRALHLKRKPKKRLPARVAQTPAVPEQQNQTWWLDLMIDALSNGTTFRTLNVIDDFNREVHRPVEAMAGDRIVRLRIGTVSMMVIMVDLLEPTSDMFA